MKTQFYENKGYSFRKQFPHYVNHQPFLLLFEFSRLKNSHPQSHDFPDVHPEIHNLKCVCSYLSRDIRPDQLEHTLLRVPMLMIITYANGNFTGKLKKTETFFPNQIRYDISFGSFQIMHSFYSKYVTKMHASANYAKVKVCLLSSIHNLTYFYSKVF